ncbi:MULTISPECIES: TPM domain-containing protein [Ralstonia solanacearum species complex]|uniref:TPM domain-containing protein n=1 Tax=Ralstonia solanacearum species complex TaxID=3116862 RepID=UPI001E2B4CF6|nr:YgcG family protein [Ralstonia solanacearum]
MRHWMSHARTSGAAAAHAAATDASLLLFSLRPVAGGTASPQSSGAARSALQANGCAPCQATLTRALSARVTDLTGTLTREQAAALEQKLQQFETEKGSQVAVLMVPTTQPEPIEQYSMRVVEQWKLGRKHADDDALLIVAKDDRAVRIEVGYGIEGVLTDAISGRIIREDIVPRFKAGNFYEGIDAGTDRIIRVIRGETLPSPRQARDEGAEPIRQLLPAILVLAVVLGGALRAFGGDHARHGHALPMATNFEGAAPQPSCSRAAIGGRRQLLDPHGNHLVFGRMHHPVAHRRGQPVDEQIGPVKAAEDLPGKHRRADANRQDRRSMAAR